MSSALSTLLLATVCCVVVVVGSVVDCVDVVACDSAVAAAVENALKPGGDSSLHESQDCNGQAAA